MKKDLVGAVIAVIALYFVMELVGITCPIKFLTGISCAGCGMSRAWLSVLRLDFASALSYHPLFWIPVPAVLVWLFRGRLPGRLCDILLITAICLFLIVYVVRMLNPNDTVVVFEPGNGFIFRCLTFILSRGG